MIHSPEEDFHELSFYTLGHPDTIYFIHQHIVDAWQAQNAGEKTKPIGLIFSLVGLYLYLEKGLTGRQVQQAHIRMSQNKKPWTLLELPDKRGELTVSDVLREVAGPSRDKAIRDWCASVWAAYGHWHGYIAGLASSELGVK